MDRGSRTARDAVIRFVDHQRIDMAVASFELQNGIAAGEPRASRMALITASVPEETIRTKSIIGKTT